MLIVVVHMHLDHSRVSSTLAAGSAPAAPHSLPVWEMQMFPAAVSAFADVLDSGELDFSFYGQPGPRAFISSVSYQLCCVLQIVQRFLNG